MKISVAQTRPVKADINANIDNHLALISLAVKHQAEAIFFPELSLTGYEPSFAVQLSTNVDDKRFDIFQQLSDQNQLIIGTGMPLASKNGPLISMIVFQPGKGRLAYSKQFLHSDEEPFFVPGNQHVILDAANKRLALAICYEIFVPAHPASAFENHANIYIASAAKTETGMKKAFDTLPLTAKNYSMNVMISNSLGPSDNFVSAGNSAAWNSEGDLLGQLDDQQQGILLLDTETNQLVKEFL